MAQRVYIDTSVIGGYYDEEFEEWSKKLFEEFQQGTRIAVVSDIVLDELEEAPEQVKALLATIPEEYLELLSSTEQAEELAETYIQERAITEKHQQDALHIAIATISQVQVLVSWNFKHIVNLERIRWYNAVNLKKGYSILEIRSPREVVNLENNE